MELEHFLEISKKTLSYVNSLLKNCDSRYKIIGFTGISKSSYVIELKRMVDDMISKMDIGCHSGASNVKKNMMFVVAIDKETDQVVSYLTFNIYPTYKTLHKMYSCTKVDHRRKSLPTLFGWFVHELALKLHLRWVVSYNVPASMGIAKRFGAIVNEDMVTKMITDEPKYESTLGEAYLFSSLNGMGSFNAIIDLENRDTIKIHEDFRLQLVECRLLCASHVNPN